MPTDPSGSVGAGGHAGTPDVAAARRILALLREDDVDAAIEAGLARFEPLDVLDATDNDALAHARDRLLAAWAARERYRTRGARMDRIAGERGRARSTRVPAEIPAQPRPALPAAAVAALARARARASKGRP